MENIKSQTLRVANMRIKLYEKIKDFSAKIMLILYMEIIYCNTLIKKNLKMHKKQIR